MGEEKGRYSFLRQIASGSKRFLAPPCRATLEYFASDQTRQPSIIRLAALYGNHFEMRLYATTRIDRDTEGPSSGVVLEWVDHAINDAGFYAAFANGRSISVKTTKLSIGDYQDWDAGQVDFIVRRRAPVALKDQVRLALMLNTALPHPENTKRLVEQQLNTLPRARVGNKYGDLNINVPLGQNIILAL